MIRTTILAPALLALAACGSAEAPEAAPGAVERTTRELDRNAAAEMNQVIRKADDEAAERADAAKKRIRASEKARTGGD